MKKLFAVMMAGVVMLGGSMAFAGGACCSGGEGAAKADKAMGCSSDTMAKLNLTDEQKTKIAALKADCTKSGCNAESRTTFTKGMKDILTADQFTQWQAASEKAAKGGCPAMKSETKSGSKN